MLYQLAITTPVQYSKARCIAGDNTNGKLGDGTSINSRTPVLAGDTDHNGTVDSGDIVGKASYNVVAGDDGTCSASNGTIPAGARGLYGQIGDNGWANRAVPTIISGYRVAGSCDDFSCGAVVLVERMRSWERSSPSWNKRKTPDQPGRFSGGQERLELDTPA